MTSTPSDSTKDTSQWPAAAVAIALIALVGTVSIAAINQGQFDNVWKALGTITGVIVGVGATYFFTARAQNTAKDALLRMEQASHQNAAKLAEAEAQRNITEAAATAMFYGLIEAEREQFRTNDLAVQQWKLYKPS